MKCTCGGALVDCNEKSVNSRTKFVKKCSRCSIRYTKLGLEAMK